MMDAGLRVMVLSNTLPPTGRGGAEAYALQLAEGLQQRGHAVVLVSGDTDGVRTSLPLRRIPALAHNGGTTAIGKALWHTRDLWRLVVHQRFGEELDSFAPNVVHTNSVQGLSSAVFSALAARSTSHVHMAHDLNLVCMRASLTRSNEYCGGHCLACRPQRLIRSGLLARRVDRVIAPSEYIRRAHLRFGVVDAPKLVTIPQGAASADSRVRPRGTGTLRVGYIGQLFVHKGIGTLLRAFESVTGDVSLEVAGAGPMEPEVRAAAAADPRLSVYGHVSGSRKAEFWDSLDVVVLPSEWEEPAPLVAAEGAIRGIPAIVSDRGGLPETPEAVVFPAGDQKALAAAIQAYVDHPESLRRASSALVADPSRFSWDRHIRAVEQVLQQAASRSLH